MNPLEQKVRQLEDRVAQLESLITTRGGNIVLTKSVQVDGRMNADRVYTQRSGSYVELTT